MRRAARMGRSIYVGTFYQNIGTAYSYILDRMRTVQESSCLLDTVPEWQDPRGFEIPILGPGKLESMLHEAFTHHIQRPSSYLTLIFMTSSR